MRPTSASTCVRSGSATGTGAKCWATVRFTTLKNSTRPGVEFFLRALNYRSTSERIMTAICSLWSPLAVSAGAGSSASPFAFCSRREILSVALCCYSRSLEGVVALVVVVHVVLQGEQVPLVERPRLLVEGDLWFAFNLHLHGACPEKRHGRMQQGAAAVCVPTIVPCAWLHELDRHRGGDT